ncbi:CRTAC1 family protein [uncultured Desulfuromonas sp.]|uniref:CRTAC1 family protein n=1 Tax=uncultured Desulfuromonas sp. TaxID=181013 RepID=UPI002610C205|nr:CRTAC1 family protein [uncultured Desulfuromonas sp.]
MKVFEDARTDLALNGPRSCPLLLAALIFLCLAGATPVAAATASPPIFEDVSEASGLDFVHFNGMTGHFYFPEMTGQGGALLDYDGDGDLDVYLLQGALLGPGDKASDALFPARDTTPRDRLFRNDLAIDKEGRRTLRFVDVTDESGLRSTGYGMGATTGDFNNDGWIDLYVTNYGPNRMLYNNGDGTFADVTAKTGTGDPQWGTSALAFDYDRDGWLDLYVANYVAFDVVKNPKCYANNSRRDYCGPSGFPAQPDRFFHNRGDGTFEEISAKVLVGYSPGPGLGVVATDVNGDGWLDFYVANDGKPNQLWLNRKGLRFEEDAMFAGASVNRDGQAEASMGVDAGDFDNDGDEDLFMTHLMGETSTLYVNDGTGFYEDHTGRLGLAAGSFCYTSFGTGWLDYDNDGWLDLFVLNGAVLVIEQLVRAKDPYPLHQPNQLFHNESGKRFVDLTAEAGEALALSEVSRGAVFGDIDNDGDTDVLVTNNNGPARLLLNRLGQDRKWLGLRLVDPSGKRDLLGTRVALKRKGKPTLWRRVRTDGSFCSANDSRILFGLGDSESVTGVEVVWPDGLKEVWNSVEPMTYTTLRKGTAKRP